MTKLPSLPLRNMKTTIMREIKIRWKPSFFKTNLKRQYSELKVMNDKL